VKLAKPSALRRLGILGLNRRNADYTLRYNQRRLYPLVDDKFQTKQLALANGLKVPELYGTIATEYENRHGLDDILAGRDDFVVKPARGSGGNGIAVIASRAGDHFKGVNGTLLQKEELQFHISNILSGLYSLGGQPDRVLIEYRVQFDPVFESISYQGVPDIRIIVFKGVPVMSMVRLPTRMSGGKANLHQGAIGAGIDLSTGTTLQAVWRNSIVAEHPDTGNPVTGVCIPQWARLLELAAGCYELTGLGYIGVDLVLDRYLGPLILELNARPGLSIQLANRSGLGRRLERIEDEAVEGMSIAERVHVATQWFGTTPAVT